MAINRFLTVSVLLGFASLSLAIAQQPPESQQQQPQSAAAKKQTEQPAQKASTAPSKTAKVWTADDLQALRSPADDYVAQQQAEAAAAASKASAPADKQPASTTPEKRQAWQKVWHIKTADDAQKAIDWDNRDIAAQTEYVEKLKKQIDAAQTPAQKEHLQKTLDDELQVIAATTQERDGIQQQKEQLQKKPATDGSASAQPPSL